MANVELRCWMPLEGVLAVAVTAAAGLDVPKAGLKVSGGAPPGGWLFHRGALPGGRQRCTWIGRAPSPQQQAVSVTFADGTTATATVPAAPSGPCLATCHADYPALGDRIAFVRQLVETAPVLLRQKGQPQFELVRQAALDRLIGDATQLPPVDCYHVSDRLRLFLLPPGEAAAEAAAVHVRVDRSLARSPFAAVQLAGGRRALLAEADFATGDAVVALLGSQTVERVDLPRALPLRGRGDILGAVRRLGPAGFDLARHLVLALAPYGGTEPAVEELVRELGLLMPAVDPVQAGGDGPVIAELELAFVTATGQLVLAGRLEDPHRLVDHAEWRVPGGPALRLPATALRPLPGPPEIREATDGSRQVRLPRHFLAVTPAPGAARHFRQHGLLLVLRSGAQIALTSPPSPPGAAARRDQLLKFLTRIDPDDALLDTVAPAVAALHAEHLAGERVSETFEVGRPRRRPEVSVVVPLYKVLSFLRHQVAAFAIDRDAAAAEFVAVLDSPEQRDELRHVLGGLEALYGIPWRVAVHSANLGYGPAVNTGARIATGRTLVLMNSDVVPADDRWLPAMRRRLGGRGMVGAVGPKLLYGDDSLQHAGLTFAVDDRQRYYNTHFYKGYPRDFPAANRARRVPGLTGACLMVTRRQFEAVGGISEDYVVGDFEDSDFSLKLAAAGRELWYEPPAELYHYERESIVRNHSYADTAACRFNQHLHTQRWRTHLQNVVDRNLR